MQPWTDAALSRYLSELAKFPMLSPEEELALARRVRATGDSVATKTLVTSHLRLVAKIAMRHRGYGLPIEDLIAEGSIGMMQAVERFDPERGFRLATYAMHWIRSAIQDYILRNWSLVRITSSRAHKALFFNLRRLKARLSAIDEGDLSPAVVEQIAKTLVVSEEAVVAMNGRLSGPDPSLNTPVREDADGEWQDWLVDDADDQEHQLIARDEWSQRRNWLHDAIRNLDDRERGIVVERQLRESPATLEALSARYHISRERVRQIETGAIEKVQRAIVNRTRAAAAARPI